MHASSPAARAGIDLGGTKIQAVIVAADHTVLGSAREATPTTGGPADVVRALASTLRAAAAEARIDARTLAGVGVGTPGAIDAHAGTVRDARNLPGFDGAVPLGPLLAQELGVTVRLGNDVGLALQAEARLGAAKSWRSFIGLWWGTGVGGGFVVDGERWLGRGAAGELGHMVVELDGARCPCGRRGCVEAYAGRRAMELRARTLVERGRRTKLFELMEKKGRDRLTSGIWAKALEKGDALAMDLIDRAERALAAGAASGVNLLDVDGVVLGGGLGTRLGEESARRIEAAMLPHLFSATRPAPVRVAALGDLSGALGAALLFA